MEPAIHKFDSNAGLATQLAIRVASDLRQAIGNRGSATLAVSGGSTPRLFFEALSEQPLAWNKVSITQVDERWVDESHVDSNARLICQYLLKNEAARANFLSMKTPGSSPFSAITAVREKLDIFSGEIDVIVLGMGEDGHTASFFPGAKTLHEALNPSSIELCVPVSPPYAPHERMTFALPSLLRARQCYLHIVGQDKYRVLEEAEKLGDVYELPIRCVLNSPGRQLEIFYAEEQ